MPSFFLQLSACLLAFCSVGASLVPRSHVVHETRDLEDDELFKRSRVAGHIEIPVRIGLTQKNLEFGGAELFEISDPDSPRYGHHYTAEEVEELFAPSHEAVAAVRGWIEQKFDSARISTSSNRQWIQFDATISEMEDLLHTEYFHYDGPVEATSGIGCDKYHVPHWIKDHIDYITPGVKSFGVSAGPSIQRRSQRGPEGKFNKPFQKPRIEIDTDDKRRPCHKRVTPHCIKKQYGINDTPPTGTTASVGVYEASAEYYNQTSLKLFLKKYTDIPEHSIPTYHAIDGAVPAGTKTFNSKEADLDLQVLFPLAHHSAKIVNYQVDDRPYQFKIKKFGFNTFLDAIDGSYCDYTAFGITGDSPKFDPTYPDPSNEKGAYKGKLQCGKYKPTDVISVSYISSENYYPMNYQLRQCNEFMKLGLQGVSFLWASGDRGVSVHFSPDGNFCLGKKNRKFGPNSPISCPYITTVGSTVLQKDGKTEVATKSFGSGGGFSNIFPRPKYQDDAVSTYLTKHTPKYRSYKIKYKKNGPTQRGLFNAAGRGYPDISAIGDKVAIIYKGKAALAGGTSASTPIMAGIITRINAYRLDAGKKPLGFLNPILYKHPEMFTDIVSGDNPGCHTRGFNATKGWDPVTGLGTPKYEKMKEILVNLP